MTISQIGLILNVIGTFAIAFWGLPSPIKDISNDYTLLYSDPTEEEKSKSIRANKTHRVKAYIGLGLIFIGFVFQLIGTTKI